MSTIQEVIRSALQAEDLRSIDAMYQTFEEIGTLFGGDFTVAEASDEFAAGSFKSEAMEPVVAVLPILLSLELYRNEPDSRIFYLHLDQGDWVLEVSGLTGDDLTVTDLDRMVEQLSSLVDA